MKSFILHDRFLLGQETPATPPQSQSWGSELNDFNLSAERNQQNITIVKAMQNVNARSKNQ